MAFGALSWTRQGYSRCWKLDLPLFLLSSTVPYLFFSPLTNHFCVNSPLKREVAGTSSQSVGLSLLTRSYILRASNSDANLAMANMTYATSSPAAMTGGQGNNPVSELAVNSIIILSTECSYRMCGFSLICKSSLLLPAFFPCLIRFSPSLLSTVLAVQHPHTRFCQFLIIKSLPILSTHHRTSSQSIHYQALHSYPFSSSSPTFSQS
jgi:hypothetical protein